MQFIVKTTPEELKRARKWWDDLEMQWKFAYNEAVFGKGPVIEPPKDDELMILLIRADTLRFAGPLAPNPNLSQPFNNLSGLIPLYHLRYLSISHTGVKSLLPLKRFTNMEHLFLYNNQIESLEGIENMIELKDLYVQNNKIKSLAPLRNLIKLDTVYVSGNELEKIDGLNLKHEENLKHFYVLPNEKLRQREIIRVQNELGIIGKKG